MGELSPVALAALTAAALLLALTALRIGLAVAVLRVPEPSEAPDLASGASDGAGTPGGTEMSGGAGAAGGVVTVMQAILAGDPTMPGHLRENLANQPDARFVWLVDETDVEGRRITAELAATAPGRVEVLLTPPLPAGSNPKVFKLVLGLPHCGELVAVLDDDTVAPAGALDRARRALRRGDLVTGVPIYRPGGNLDSRLVAAFVNGNSLLTYLPMLTVAEPVTINGMFYLTRRGVLERLGGFAAIVDRLCDDYELAKLYRRAGLRIVQTTIVHPLATTVPGLTGYLRLLRRWLIFANQLLREALTPQTIALVVLPQLLPLTALVLALVSGRPWALAAVGAALVAKASAVAVLRRRVAGTREGPGTVVLEVVADLLLPLHAVGTAVRPRRIVWRDKIIRTERGGVTHRVAGPGGPP